MSWRSACSSSCVVRDRRRSSYSIQWRHERQLERYTLGSEQVLDDHWVGKAYVSTLLAGGCRSRGGQRRERGQPQESHEARSPREPLESLKRRWPREPCEQIERCAPREPSEPLQEACAAHANTRSRMPRRGRMLPLTYRM